MDALMLGPERGGMLRDEGVADAHAAMRGAEALAGEAGDHRRTLLRQDDGGSGFEDAGGVHLPARDRGDDAGGVAEIEASRAGLEAQRRCDQLQPFGGVLGEGEVFGRDAETGAPQIRESCADRGVGRGSAPLGRLSVKRGDAPGPVHGPGRSGAMSGPVNRAPSGTARPQQDARLRDDRHARMVSA
jgi:hypothetical protein